MIVVLYYYKVKLRCIVRKMDLHDFCGVFFFILCYDVIVFFRKGLER